MTTQMLFFFMIVSLSVASTKEQASSIESRSSGTGVDDTIQQLLQSLSEPGVQKIVLRMLQSLNRTGIQEQEQLKQLLKSLNGDEAQDTMRKMLQSLSGSELQKILHQMVQSLNRSGSSGIVKNDQAKFGKKNMFISIFIGVSIFVIIILTVGGVYYI
jgi:hypothetical protein